MSNCINCGIKKMFIMTHFTYFPLNRHLAKIYNFGNGVNFGDGFVEVMLAAHLEKQGRDGSKEPLMWLGNSYGSLRRLMLTWMKWWLLLRSFSLIVSVLWVIKQLEERMKKVGVPTVPGSDGLL